MPTSPGVVTFLFTDIEGSSRLWEAEPERMRATMERHDAICRAAVAEHRGRVVKMLGDGVHAAFEDPLDAVAAAIAMQRALAAAAANGGSHSPCGRACTRASSRSATTTTSAAPSTAPPAS